MTDPSSFFIWHQQINIGNHFLKKNNHIIHSAYISTSPQCAYIQSENKTIIQSIHMYLVTAEEINVCRENRPVI